VRLDPHLCVLFGSELIVDDATMPRVRAIQTPEVGRVQLPAKPFREMRRLFAAEAVSAYIAFPCTSTVTLHIGREGWP
jgi:hypothetical protein